MQAQAKVQEGTVKWRSSVNSWELCGRPGHRTADVPGLQRTKQRTVTAEYACDSGESGDKSWNLSRAV